MDWFSSPCTDATRMGKPVQIVVLPETPTVPGMEMHALDTHPLQKGKRHIELRDSLLFYTVNISHACLVLQFHEKIDRKHGVR